MAEHVRNMVAVFGVLAIVGTLVLQVRFAIRSRGRATGSDLAAREEGLRAGMAPAHRPPRARRTGAMAVQRPAACRHAATLTIDDEDT